MGCRASGGAGGRLRPWYATLTLPTLPTLTLLHVRRISTAAEPVHIRPTSEHPVVPIWPESLAWTVRPRTFPTFDTRGDPTHAESGLRLFRPMCRVRPVRIRAYNWMLTD